jgi:hypothetical protein
MKGYTMNVRDDYTLNESWLKPRLPVPQPGGLYLVSAHDVRGLEVELTRGNVPADFEAKLKRLAGDSLLHRSVEQNCRLFMALIQAAKEGSFRQASEAEKERLLRVLAYVRKDDDAIPDYKPGGFVDDQREVRAAAIALQSLLETFKSWRLRYQVPGMWGIRDGVVE